MRFALPVRTLFRCPFGRRLFDLALGGAFRLFTNGDRLAGFHILAIRDPDGHVPQDAVLVAQETLECCHGAGLAEKLEQEVLPLVVVVDLVRQAPTTPQVQVKLDPFVLIDDRGQALTKLLGGGLLHLRLGDEHQFKFALIHSISREAT